MNLKKILKPDMLLIPICVVAIGLLPLSTNYYLLVRITVFIFGLSAFLVLPFEKYGKEKVIFLILAIIYNPIIPVYFGSKMIWFPINLFTIYLFWRFRKEQLEYEP